MLGARWANAKADLDAGSLGGRLAETVIGRQDLVSRNEPTRTSFAGAYDLAGRQLHLLFSHCLFSLDMDPVVLNDFYVEFGA